MGSPLTSAAWWFPELKKGREPLDNFFDVINQWAPTQRLRNADGKTFNNLIEVIKLVQKSDMRFVQATVGAVEELPAHQEVQEAVLTRGGEGIFFGVARTQLDGLFDTEFLLTSQFVSEKIIEWRIDRFECTLPPLINQSPRQALGRLRELEDFSLQRLASKNNLIRPESDLAEDLRNALIDLDQKLLVSDVAAYPKSVTNDYLQLLNAADHVLAIVEVVETHASHAEQELRPLIRAAQNARGAAWAHWMFTESS